MRPVANDEHNINLRDLEFENKVWKNKLEYLIREINIYIHHLEAFQFELKESISEPLLQESLIELNEDNLSANSLMKKVIIQEEEIPMYIKDFPIDQHHELFTEHQSLEREVTAFYEAHKQCINAIRTQYSAMLRI